MFDGGKKAQPELPEKEPEIVGKDIPMRVFAMPEELRGKAAIFHEEPKKQAPEALQPLIIPVPVPSPAQPPKAPHKKRLSPALIILFVLVLMVGTGAGVWWYVVTYASPAQTPNTPPPTPNPIIEPDPIDPTPYPGVDTDSDGLTDVEELLYGTDFRSPDTDGDTFLDGNEVFHGYDPNGLAPSTLLDTGAVRVFERTNLPFTIYYPASWSISTTTAETEVVFRSKENGSVTLIYEEKDLLTTLSEWMREKNISAKGIEETMTKEGFPARNAENGRTAYLDLGDWVVTAVYDLGEGLSIEFLKTFKMMVNSVMLIEGSGGGGTSEEMGGNGTNTEEGDETDREAILNETNGEG